MSEMRVQGRVVEALAERPIATVTLDPDTKVVTGLEITTSVGPMTDLPPFLDLGIAMLSIAEAARSRTQHASPLLQEMADTMVQLLSPKQVPSSRLVGKARRLLGEVAYELAVLDSPDGLL